MKKLMYNGMKTKQIKRKLLIIIIVIIGPVCDLGGYLQNMAKIDYSELVNVYSLK